jgi:hypothetical protein
MKQIEELRKDTIKMIMLLNDFDALQKFNQQIKSYSTPKFMEAVRPIRENVSFEQILKEQVYKTISYQSFRKEASVLGEDRALDELLYSLSA